MFKQKIRFVLIAGSLVLGTLGMLIFSPAASAEPPHQPMLDSTQVPPIIEPDGEGEKWAVEVFNDPKQDHDFLANFDVCFRYVGIDDMQGKYRWCVPAMNLHGIARMEGDQVFMHHIAAAGIQHSYAHWEVVSEDEGAGHWRYWRQPAAP